MQILYAKTHHLLFICYAASFINLGINVTTKYVDLPKISVNPLYIEQEDEMKEESYEDSKNLHEVHQTETRYRPCNLEVTKLFFSKNFTRIIFPLLKAISRKNYLGIHKIQKFARYCPT